MKIHFIIPPPQGKKVLDRICGTNYGYFPHHNVFFLSAATLMRESGFEVEVSDCLVEKISLETAIAGGGDAFVFYSVFLSRNLDLAAAAWLKRKKRVPIVFLGSDPSCFSDKYLKKEGYFVIRGEPEYTLLRLCQALKKRNTNFSKIKSLSWVKKGKIVHNPAGPFIDDLDRLPIPDRMLYKTPFAYPNARFSQLPSTTALFSRGCAHRCYYCFPNSLSYARELDYKRNHRTKPPVRVKSAEKVIEELKLIARQGFRSVSILDDQFLWSRKRTDKILAAIKNLSLEIAILARCDKVTDLKLAKDMHRVGIKHIAFGVESFNQEILDYTKKDLKVEAIEKSILFCKKVGIEPEVNILIGSCPLETKKTIADTLEKVKKLNIDIVHINICAPYPGTEFARLAKAKGWMTVPEYFPIESSAQSLISYPHLSDKDLVKVVKKFILEHYFSPKYLWKKLGKINSLADFWSKSKAGLNQFKLLFVK